MRRRWLPVLLGLTALLVLGHLYQRAMETRDARAHAPPGELVVVDGRRMHLHCQGEGSPTVVLIAGLGGFSMDWVRLQAPLSRVTRTCSVDRAGYGWSDPGPEPRDIARNAWELERLLSAAVADPPYLLVGHSLGGAHALRFAQEHPDQTAGVVLVDVPDRAELRREADGAASRDRTQRLFYGSLRLLAGSGLLRVLAGATGDAIAPDTIHHLAEGDRGAYRTVMLRREPYRTASRELRHLPSGATQLAGDGALGRTPLIIITATEVDSDEWPERQAALLALSSRSEQRLAEGSSHFVHLDRPEVILRAVDDLIDTLRSAH